ncbi:MAG: signal peptidase II [Propionibacteriaceae bacterium]|nr:signal peptidase II [Propionibacteriaceae bacterium]
MTLSRRWSLMMIVGLTIAGVGLDQVTKALAVARLQPHQPVSLVGDILELALVRNPGAAFGTGTSLTLGFTILAMIVVVVVCLAIIPRVRSAMWAVIIGMGMAGVIGNLIDRLFQPPAVFRGHVIDFISLKHFAVFNVADIFLTCAAGLAIIVSWRTKSDPQES